MPRKESFEDYLMEQYLEIENPHKDYAVEGYENWIECIDIEDIINHAECYALIKQEELIKRLEKANG